MKLIGYILFQFPQPFHTRPNPCYNTTTMKHKKRTQHIKTTKTGTRHPKNIHQKTTITEQIKNAQKMKNSKFSKTPINPVPDWYNPKYQNAQMCKKHPFFVRF